MTAKAASKPAAKKAAAKTVKPALKGIGGVMVRKSVAGSGMFYEEPEQPRRLSDPEMKPTIDALKKRISEDPAFRRSLLQSAGLIDKRGKPTKAFGG